MGESPRLTIDLKGARLFCLRILVFLPTLPCDSGVGADTFAFSGFKEDSLHVVSDSNWFFDTTTGCFQFNPVHEFGSTGRFPYPDAVQMIDPGSKAVKSFNTSFIYGIERFRCFTLSPGMTFIIVPDDLIVRASAYFMGLVTPETSDTAKKYKFGIKSPILDLAHGTDVMYWQLDSKEEDPEQDMLEYNDFDQASEFKESDQAEDVYPEQKPRFEHSVESSISITSASMTCNYSFPPGKSSSVSRSRLYLQIWIEYSEADSRMDIYVANYKEGKPAKPQRSRSQLNSSLLKEKMFAGFSSASYDMKFRASSDVPLLCAWSFSNDGSPAPPIVLAQDEKKNLWIPVGIPLLLPVFVGMIICIIVALCWCQFVSRPLRIFLSHAGGPDGSQKNFPTWLDERMRTWPWSVAKSRVKIFFDTEDVEMGRSIAKEILRELASFDVGVVVVTNAFFVAKWPMTELIAFVEAQKNDPTERIRVLPLFYELSPEQIRAHLAGKTWDGNWEEMSKGSHPLQVEKCREAVTWLCQQRGIPYGYKKRHQDKDYIETICKEVDRILCKERSFKSYLLGNVKTYCVPRRSITKKLDSPEGSEGWTNQSLFGILWNYNKDNIYDKKKIHLV